MSKRVFIFTLFAVMLLCTPVLWAQHYIGVRGGAGGGGVFHGEVTLLMFDFEISRGF